MTTLKKSLSLSVLIIVKGRKDHLLNVITALELSSLTPFEVIIVHMNEPAYVTDSSLTITHVSLQTNEPLPLAVARNRAAQVATGNTLLFLDVDCIPAQTCLTELVTNFDIKAITMIDPLYLSKPVTHLDFQSLEDDAHPNAVRSGLTFGYSDAYELFWSLGFIISKQCFELIGGFDEQFTGYGGEDTDFAFTARNKKVPLIYSPARVYHQPHPSYEPPLNWLKDIVTNARVFYEKWGIWPMEGWLHSFTSAGYISFQNNTIEILRLPTETEISGAQQL